MTEPITSFFTSPSLLPLLADAALKSAILLTLAALLVLVSLALFRVTGC